MVSAVERHPLFLSAIKRLFYETMTLIPSVLRISVLYKEVSAIKHIRCREVPLYFFTYLLLCNVGRAKVAMTGNFFGHFWPSYEKMMEHNRQINMFLSIEVQISQ